MPPIGFQAAAGSPPMPSASQPFQGKSLSFTVRMNIGECRPVDRIVADVLDPGRILDIDVFALHRVAGDDFPAAAGERRDEVALQIDALDQAR